MTVERKLIIDCSLDSSSVLTYPYKSFYLRPGVRTFTPFPIVMQAGLRALRPLPPTSTDITRRSSWDDCHRPCLWLCRFAANRLWSQTRLYHLSRAPPLFPLASSLISRYLFLVPSLYLRALTHAMHMFSRPPTHLQLLQINKEGRCLKKKKRKKKTRLRSKGCAVNWWRWQM